MPVAVLTRADVAAYAAALPAWQVIALPVTASEHPRDPEALAMALSQPHDAVLVASARAAQVVVTDKPVWAVGPATAAMFPTARVGGGDGASTARALLAAMGPVRVLVPRAEEGRDDAIAILRAGGATVIDAIAYRTVPLAFDPAAFARADVVACFAPSQANLLPPLTCPIVAIGETTAAALRARGYQPAVAASPTPEGIANAVALLYPLGR